MIGVVLAAHGEVAPALLKAAETIVGPLEAVKAISLGAGNSPEAMRAAVVDAVGQVDHGEGVLLLVDMFGGTPFNMCLSTQCGVCIEVVTGVNLPMLLKLASARPTATNLQEVAAQIALYGQRNISHASALMRERRRAAEAAAANRPPPAAERSSLAPVNFAAAS